jgi:hypothetical protein
MLLRRSSTLFLVAHAFIWVSQPLCASRLTGTTQLDTQLSQPSAWSSFSLLYSYVAKSHAKHYATAQHDVEKSNIVSSTKDTVQK